MKTISLQTAIEQATKGPLKIGNSQMELVLWSNDGDIATVYHGESALNAEPNAALLAHFFNHGPELVKALKAATLSLESLCPYTNADLFQLLERVEKVEVAE